ncbi:hypothetical protein NQ318_011197 [Aromia moschata]|uniref:RNA-directed DNA polymerase n=1 Tax=Aromia moschata TaxID=1265417 RepID=A0AAV8X236_9CUCU|nr:hypothetical protein NQ318_011197 [Aromia moschata]
MNPVMVNLVGVTETDWFLTVQLQDDKIQAIVKAIEQGKADNDVKANFKVKNGRLWRITTDGDRLYVPSSAKFSLVSKHHDDIGHPGFERCLELLRKTYWFPKMRQFVHKYTASCLSCAYAKGDYGRGEGFLHPYEKRAVPFDTVHIDHLGPYLLVVIDAFTKYTLAKPTKTLSSAEAIENLRWIFGEFGYPRRIISDQGLAFTSKAFASFMAEKRHATNAVATPRTNGQVERSNRTLIEAITASAAGEARWDEQLPEILWGINHTKNASTRFSPAELLFSYQGGRVAGLSVGDNTAAEGRKRVHANRRQAGESLQKAAERMKVRYDKRRKVTTEYKAGDLVLWRQAATALREKGVNQKMANKYDGPYRVDKVLENDRYEISSLQGVRGYKRYRVVAAADALRRYQIGAFKADDGSADDSEDSERDQSGRQDLIDLLEGWPIVTLLKKFWRST